MARLETRLLRADEIGVALAYLMDAPQENLLLIDLVARVGAPPLPGEARVEVVAAYRSGEIAGIAALRPSVVFDARVEADAADALLPFLDSLGVGLVKSPVPLVDRAWSHLSRRARRRGVVDRIETAYALREADARLIEPGDSRNVRPARREDLEPLVVAARESLREEDRPDPFSGDVRGFRRWVKGRVPRARVVEECGRVVFVGYADVRRPEGWLLQGIYTWPDVRRRGHAAAGTSELCREAFGTGRTDHVQLAVVEGNESARALYEGLGFKPFGRLRTILFT
jgi:RimJ/RimL family protein N-acetyltransferase